MRGREGGRGSSRCLHTASARIPPQTDPTKYREAAQLEQNKPFDPLIRIRLYLSQCGLWSEEEEYEIMDAARTEVEKAVADAESAPPPEPSDIFHNTWKREHPYLKKQEDELAAFLKETAVGGEPHA